MKILIWNESYIAGGQCKSIIELINHWPSVKDEITLYVNRTHEGFNLIDKKIRKNVTLNSFDSLIENTNSFFVQFPFLKNWLFRKILIIYFGILLYYDMIKSINKYDALILNNGGYPGGLTNFLVILTTRKFKKIKKLMIVRNYQSIHYSKSLIMILIKIIVNHFNVKVVAVSDNLKFSLQNLSGIDSQLLYTIHNGTSIILNQNVFSPNFIRNSNNIDLLVGIIGTLLERKGHKILFHAWAEVLKEFPDAKLLIIGSSTSGNKDDLIKVTNELKISSSIEWVDFTYDIEKIYMNLDIVVMPSQEYESFGRIVIEAMAYKKPIIASRVGGIPELINHEVDGYLFDKNDILSLSLHLKNLLGSKDLRTQIGEEGHKTFISNFTSSIMAKRYHDLLVNSDLFN